MAIPDTGPSLANPGCFTQAFAVTTLSRAATSLSEKIRSEYPDGASAELMDQVMATGRARGPVRADDRIRLGSRERSVLASRLAIGSGTDGINNSSQQTRELGLKGLSDLYLHAFHKHDLNFWESADMYGSHPHLALALKQVPRDQIVVLTKTTAESPESMRQDLDRFRRELGIEHIDILLMHCMIAPDWPEKQRGVMDVISQAQQDGIIGLKGVSCHSFGALEAAANEPWVEVDLARINPGAMEMDAGPDRVVPVLEGMKADGKTLLGMKILGNQKMTDHIDTCVRFVLGLPCIDAFTIGFKSKGELDRIVELIAASDAGD